jgi:hypothetical protein
MNKRLEKEFGECVVEKGGWHWALTNFAVEAWSRVKEKSKTKLSLGRTTR